MLLRVVMPPVNWSWNACDVGGLASYA